MSKNILYLMVPIILACNFLIPPSRQGNTPPPTPLEPAPEQSTASTPEVYSASSFTIARIHTQGGDLLMQLTVETQKAKELHQLPFIEFDATWCPPCNAINKSIKAEDPITMQAFENVYLIRADVDEWGWGDGANFNFDAIPIYYQLDENGRPTGVSMDGGAWNEDIPENFSPVLDEFFHTK